MGSVTGSFGRDLHVRPQGADMGGACTESVVMMASYGRRAAEGYSPVTGLRSARMGATPAGAGVEGAEPPAWRCGLTKQMPV